MDSKIMDLINAEISRIQVRGRKKYRYKQYEQTKKRLSAMFPGQEEHEYICKSIARKYRL